MTNPNSLDQTHASFGQRRSFFVRVLDRLRNWSAGSVESVGPTEPGDSAGKDDARYLSAFDGIGEMPKVEIDGDIAGDKKLFLAYMSRIGEQFRRAGEFDGIGEQKFYAIHEIVRNRVLQIRAYLESMFRAEYDKADVDIATKLQRLTDAECEADAQTKYAETLRGQYFRNYKEFPKTLGVIYLIVALLLIFADVPLAVKLTKEGFQLQQLWEVLADVDRHCTLYCLHKDLLRRVHWIRT